MPVFRVFSAVGILFSKNAQNERQDLLISKDSTNILLPLIARRIFMRRESSFMFPFCVKMAVISANHDISTAGGEGRSYDV